MHVPARHVLLPIDMELRIVFVGVAAVVACAWSVKALFSSWQRSRSIDVGGVSTAWLVEQRVDRNPQY